MTTRGSGSVPILAVLAALGTACDGGGTANKDGSAGDTVVDSRFDGTGGGSGSGGTMGSGGTPGSGGASGSGGAGSGGTQGSGGEQGSGGTTGSGGTPGSGGAGSGGTQGSGGAGSGGAGSGGTPGSGGAGSGGAQGSGGAAGSGGKPGSGGAQGSGGATGSGGTTGSGGAQGSGGAAGSGGTPGVSQFRALPPLDILFVVDNSPSMETSQTNLHDGFGALMNALRTMPNAPVPSLHVGVITTDMGSGSFITGVPGCTKQPWGDQGRLQNTPGFEYTWNPSANRFDKSPLICEVPTDRYISAAEGETLRNYFGSMEDAFGCIAPVGTEGCGYESQIGSTLKALGGMGGAPAENAGFVRSDARLAIVMITDEDDCSPTLDSAICDPSSSNLAGPFGPLTSYRCSAFNQMCNSQPLPLRPTDAASWPVTLTNCESSETPYTVKVKDAINFLRSLKPRQEMVQLAVVAGPTTPYQLRLNSDLPALIGYPGEQWPEITPSCHLAAPAGPGLSASPAVRLTQLAGAFGQHGAFHSLCNPFVDTMTAIGDKLAAHATLHCLDAQQATGNCTVTLHRLDEIGVPFSIPECSSAGPTGGPKPCWYRESTNLCGSGSRLALNDSRPLSSQTLVSVTCN